MPDRDGDHFFKDLPLFGNAVTLHMIKGLNTSHTQHADNSPSARFHG